jgi:hypothetical protein
MYSGRFAKTVNVQNCYVRICNVKTCYHNEEKECVLPEITLDEDGKCMQIKKIDDPLSQKTKKKKKVVKR